MDEKKPQAHWLRFVLLVDVKSRRDARCTLAPSSYKGLREEDLMDNQN
jgi:hypothetical protein